MQTPEALLAEAEALLGQRAIKIDTRGWALFWCPFHADEARSGHRKRPNFGVSLREGHWKCLRCGAAGPSLRVLARRLGRDVDRLDLRPVTPLARPRSPIPALAGVLSQTRLALWQHTRAEGARDYLASRRVSRVRALEYGLGYGLPAPDPDPDALGVARQTRLAVEKAGRLWWAWARGIVYGEPPHRPEFVHCRHLRRGARQKYQTWGQITRPLGAWRVTAATHLVIAVEGLFDMLALAEVLARRRLLGEIVPVATVGASPSADVITWLAEFPGTLVLVPDPDEAGEAWVERIAGMRHAEPFVATPPDGRDPDEAVHAGWFPFPI